MTCYKDGWRSKISWRSLCASGKMYKRERGTKSSSFFKYQLSPQFTGFIDFHRMPMNHRKRTQESWVPATLTNFSKHPPAPWKAGWCGNHTHVHLCTHSHARAHACAHKDRHHTNKSVSWHWLSAYSMQCHLQNSEEIKILKTPGHWV